MEAWFYADKDALENYFGRGFHRDSLKRNQNVEQISKKDLKNGLRAATKNCLKGPYHKTRHAPELLGRISPEAVQNAAPNCRKLFESVLATLR